MVESNFPVLLYAYAETSDKIKSPHFMTATHSTTINRQQNTGDCRLVRGRFIINSKCAFRLCCRALWIHHQIVHIHTYVCISNLFDRRYVLVALSNYLNRSHTNIPTQHHAPVALATSTFNTIKKNE